MSDNDSRISLILEIQKKIPDPEKIRNTLVHINVGLFDEDERTCFIRYAINTDNFNVFEAVYEGLNFKIDTNDFETMKLAANNYEMYSFLKSRGGIVKKEHIEVPLRKNDVKSFDMFLKLFNHSSVNILPDYDKLIEESIILGHYKILSIVLGDNVTFFKKAFENIIKYDKKDVPNDIIFNKNLDLLKGGSTNNLLYACRGKIDLLVKIIRREDVSRYIENREAPNYFNVVLKTERIIWEQHKNHVVKNLRQEYDHQVQEIYKQFRKDTTFSQFSNDELLIKAKKKASENITEKADDVLEKNSFNNFIVKIHNHI